MLLRTILELKINVNNNIIYTFVNLKLIVCLKNVLFTYEKIKIL